MPWITNATRDDCSNSSRRTRNIEGDSMSRDVVPSRTTTTFPGCMPTTTNNSSVVSLHENDSVLSDHQDDDDSMFILLPPKCLASQVNTQELLVSPSTQRCAAPSLVCDWNQPDSGERDDLRSESGTNKNCLDYSSAHMGTSENDETARHDYRCEVGSRLLAARTPPRLLHRLHPRRCPFQLDQSANVESPWFIPEDFAVATGVDGAVLSNCPAMTPSANQEPAIKSPPLLRRHPPNELASLPLPLPVQMRLPSL